MARIEIRKLTVGRAACAAAVSAFILFGSISSADAQNRGPTLGGVLGGAAVGAVIGGAANGGKGAAVGAGIGAVVGGAASAAARPAPPPPRYGPPRGPVYNNGLVYNIQLSLTNLGYDPGPSDGVYGRRTADAISAYQYNNQLPVTGQPSQAVYSHMRQSGG